MHVTIDTFGRILIPKAIRDRLGLASGTRLVLETTANHELFLRPEQEEALLVQKGEALVFVGQPTDDLRAAVAEMREERSDALTYR